MGLYENRFKILEELPILDGSGIIEEVTEKQAARENEELENLYKFDI